MGQQGVAGGEAKAAAEGLINVSRGIPVTENGYAPVDL